MWRPLRRHHIEVARAENKSAAAPARVPAVETQAAPCVPTLAIKWKECIERLLLEDGFVVQGSSEEMVKGSSARMWGSERPFLIIGEAGYAEALRQWRIYQEISGEQMEPPPPASARWHYYKFGIRA